VSKIFELYGYRLDRWNSEAENNLSRAWCPFMDAECDGGGNRFQSAIDLRVNPELQEKIPNKDIIQVGICSLLPRTGEQPWIVCPRRLLSLKGGSLSDKQSFIRKQLSDLVELDISKKHLAWSEVKIKTESTNNGDEAKSFDYTFDYIVSGVQRKKVEEIAELISLKQYRFEPP